MNAPDVEQRIAAFIGKYTPAVAAQLREARDRMRSHFPRGFELVFDNYNALVFGISPTERASESFLSVAGYPKWIRLFFLHGVSLKDPLGLLEGTGSQVRSIRLTSPMQLAEVGTLALMAQAIEPYGAALSAAPPLTTLVKAVASLQRPRRPSSSQAKARLSKHVA